MIIVSRGTVSSAEHHTVESIISLEWLMASLDAELTQAGELVASHGLVDPSQGKTISLADGTPVVSDGPFTEATGPIAGFWIVDATEERALEIATEVVARTGSPVEVRRVMHG